jgi:hypothetical protein
MATIISTVKNNSDTPVAYVGQGGVVPTGWSSWGFPAHDVFGFNWIVETTKGKQALLTKSGAYFIWDDGNWNIKCQQAGHAEFVLTHVDMAIPIAIELTVNENGEPSALQKK